MDTDLDIKNYNMNDILKLFNINEEEFDKNDLEKAYDICLKLHPKKSLLPEEYFNFYIKAYKSLVKYYKTIIKDDNDNTNNIISDHFSITQSTIQELQNKLIVAERKNSEILEEKEKLTNQILHLESISENNRDKYSEPYLSSLISVPKNYRLDRRIITFHSEDRDQDIWPNSNEFEFILPVPITNVISLRLANIQLPANYYVFTNNNQNTKLAFTLGPIGGNPSSGGTRNTQEYNALVANMGNSYIITIEEGFYSPMQIVKQFEYRMNNVVKDYLINYGGVPTANNYNYFKVFYDSVDQKIWFGNTIDNFKIIWGEPIDYDLCGCIPAKNGCAWFRPLNWGLGSYIGFTKDDFSGNKTVEPLFFFHNNAYFIPPDPSGAWNNDPSGASYYVSSTNTICLLGPSDIYMELDKYNSMDELVPYQNDINATYLDGRYDIKYLNPFPYGGKHKAAFAKIPILATPNQRYFTSANDYLSNITFSTNPIERIFKFKFKFRYHDDTLVDFRGCELNFSLEANCLLSEIPKYYDVHLSEYYKV